MVSPKKYILGWFSSSLLIMLILGVLQSYSYDITIDSVRSIDFKIVNAALQSVDPVNKEQKDSLEKGVFAQFWYGRILNESGCRPRQDADFICDAVMNRSHFLDLVSENNVVEKYGQRIVKIDDNFFTFSELPSSKEILVVSAGSYTSLSSTFERVLYFFDRVQFYLFTKVGFTKFVYKSKGIWLFSLLINSILFLAIYLRDRRQKAQYEAVKKKSQLAHEALVNSREELSRIQLEKEKLETEFLAEVEASEILSKQASAEITKKSEEYRLELEQKEREALLILEEYETEIKSLKNQVSQLPSDTLKSELENALERNQKIQNLWLHDVSWSDRYDIEKEFVDASIPRTPFTIYVAFSSYERLIKNLMIRNNLSLEDEQYSNSQKSIQVCIRELRNNGAITPSDFQLFDEMRKARNRWVHECKSPDEELFVRLLKKLQTAPRTFPVF